MQFVVERDGFLTELSRVTGVIEVRHTIPILGNVHIDAGAGGLLLRATDLDIEAEAPCAADVTAQGATTVGGKLLAEFVKRCPEGAQIAVTLDGAAGRLKLACGRARSILPVLPAEDFPQLSGPAGETSRAFTVEAEALKRMIDRVKFAAGRDETQPCLHGLYLHQVGERLCGVATDIHRLSLAGFGLPAGADGLAGVILPRKLLGELARLLPKEGEAALIVSPERVAVTLGEFRLCSNLIAGTFPDYPRVIPAERPRKAFIDRALLLKAVERVAIVSNDKARSMRMTFAAGELRLAAQNPARGVCCDVVEAVCEGEEVQTGCNSGYLREILGTLECDRICVAFGDPRSPFVITDAEEPDGADLVVLMPMSVDGINEEKEAA